VPRLRPALFFLTLHLDWSGRLIRRLYQPSFDVLLLAFDVGVDLGERDGVILVGQVGLSLLRR